MLEATAKSRVFRVGFRPEPWAWPSWEWSTNGRFSGRLDDPKGNVRTIYAGSTLRACLLEVLAPFRKDQHLAAEMDEIEENSEDHVIYLTVSPVEVLRAWLETRSVTSARLEGKFFEVTDSMSVAFLQPQFIGSALQLGLEDFDAAVLKDSRARPLTQAVALWIFESTDLDGISFISRHGDDLKLSAIFERSTDTEISPLLREIQEENEVHHEILVALNLLGLKWQLD